ncbi:MAG TPA: helix-turn-helix domain-containing protein [Planctomicrobium sp.]|nr:helix-turn-helix domain-containing protein [Planctomicrobium sp.]
MSDKLDGKRPQPEPTSSMKPVTGLRAVLEGFASREAASRVASGSSPDALLELFKKMGLAAENSDYPRLAEIDRQLHRSIVELADVPGLLDAWEAVFQAQNEFRTQTIDVCWPDIGVLFESHRALVDAVAAGDAAEAAEAARTHLDAVWFRLALATSDQSMPDDPLARACAYLAFHFHETVLLPQIAQEVAGCSTGHLARLFRERTGLSFSDYLIELRLQKAAQLLQQTNRTIRDIARKVGYWDPSRFATHFRRRFAESPIAFRHRLSPITARRNPQRKKS